MTDRIFVHRLAVYGFHGLLPEEERIGQRFYISLVAEVDCRRAGETDDFTETVNYAEMADIAAAVATGRRFRLIEALAEAIAGDILARLPKVAAITVRVDKPSAPVRQVIEGVAVEIRRARDHG